MKKFHRQYRSSVGLKMSSDEDSSGSNVTSDSYRAIRFANSLKKEAAQEDALAKLASAAASKAKPRIPFVRTDNRYKEIKEELARKAKKRQTQEIIQE